MNVYSHNMSTLAVIAVAAVFVTAHAQAALIVTPTSANASSVKGTGDAVHTIDGSGLYTNSSLTTPDDSITGIHFASATGFNSNWSWVWNDGSGNPVISEEWIEFDLGQEYQLKGAYVWQTTFNNTVRQTRTFDIDTSTDDVSYSTVLANALLPQVTTLANGAPATHFDFGTTVTARYVRFEIDGTYENPAGNQNWLGGIGEAKFEVVPEPSSLILLGLGGLLLMNRKRR